MAGRPSTPTAGYRFIVSDELIAEMIERVSGREPVFTEEQFVYEVSASVEPK